MNSKVISIVALTASAVAIAIDVYVIKQVKRTEKVINDFVDEILDREDRLFDAITDDDDIDDLDEEFSPVYETEETTEEVDDENDSETIPVSDSTEDAEDDTSSVGGVDFIDDSND